MFILHKGHFRLRHLEFWSGNTKLILISDEVPVSETSKYDLGIHIFLASGEHMHLRRPLKWKSSCWYYGIYQALQNGVIWQEG